MAKTPEEQLGVSLPDPEPVEIQPDPTTELAAEESAADERPEWLPENFKSGEDLVKSYGESRNALNRETQQRQQLEHQLQQREQELQQMQQQAQQAAVQAQYDPSDQGEQFRAWQEEDPYSANAWLAQQATAPMAQQFAQQLATLEEQQLVAEAHRNIAQADLTMAQRYPDWTEVKARVGAALAEDPLLMSDEVISSLPVLERRIEKIYKFVKAEDLLAEQEQLRERGVQQEDVSRARKLGAATLPGASGRAPELSQADRELAEMKQARARGSWAAVRESSAKQ